MYEGLIIYYLPILYDHKVCVLSLNEITNLINIHEVNWKSLIIALCYFVLWHNGK